MKTETREEYAPVINNTPAYYEKQAQDWSVKRLARLVCRDCIHRDTLMDACTQKITPGAACYPASPCGLHQAETAVGIEVWAMSRSPTRFA